MIRPLNETQFFSIGEIRYATLPLYFAKMAGSIVIAQSTLAIYAERHPHQGRPFTMGGRLFPRTFTSSNGKFLDIEHLHSRFNADWPPSRLLCGSRSCIIVKVGSSATSVVKINQLNR